MGRLARGSHSLWRHGHCVISLADSGECREVTSNGKPLENVLRRQEPGAGAHTRPCARFGGGGCLLAARGAWAGGLQGPPRNSKHTLAVWWGPLPALIRHTSHLRGERPCWPAGGAVRGASPCRPPCRRPRALSPAPRTPADSPLTGNPDTLRFCSRAAWLSDAPRGPCALGSLARSQPGIFRSQWQVAPFPVGLKTTRVLLGLRTCDKGTSVVSCGQRAPRFHGVTAHGSRERPSSGSLTHSFARSEAWRSGSGF